MLGGTFLGETFLGEGLTLPATQTVACTGISSATTVFLPSATTIVVLATCTPTGLPSTVAFGAPTLSAATHATVLPTGIATVAQAFPATAITVLAHVDDRTLRLRPPGIRAPNGIGFVRSIHIVAVAPQTISVAGIPPNGTYTNQAGAAYTDQAGQSYTIEGFPTIGLPTVTLVLTVLPTGIASTNQFGAPTVRGPSRIPCVGIASTVAFGAPVLAALSSAIFPTGIPSTVAFGKPGSLIATPVNGIGSTVQFGVVAVSHAAFWNVEEPFPRWTVGFPHGRWYAFDARDPEAGATYTPVDPPAGPPRQQVPAAGVVSTVAFGTPAFPAPGQSVHAAAIASTGTFGVPALALGSAGTARPLSISSTVALGSPRARAGGAFTGPAGLASTVVLGQPSVARPPARSLHPTGIVSTVVVGASLAKRPNPKILSPAGRTSTVAFGAPAVTRGVIIPPPPLTLQQQIDATPVGGTLNIGAQQFVVPKTFAMTKSMRITGAATAFIKLATNNPTDAAARNMPVIDIQANNFTIDGFQIIGDSPSNKSFVITKEARHAIQVSGTTNTIIRNMNLHNTYGDGVAAIKDGGGNWCLNLKIEDCVLDQIGRVGITLDNVDGGHVLGTAPGKMVIRRHNNSAVDIEPPGTTDGCKNFTIDTLDVYFNVGAGFTISSAGRGGPGFNNNNLPWPDPSTYTVGNLTLQNIRSFGAAFTITISPPWPFIPASDDTSHAAPFNPTATSNGPPATIDLAGAGWTVNQWANFDVIVTGGTGAGQRLPVSTNQTTRLTLSGNFNTALDTTSVIQLALHHNATQAVRRGPFFVTNCSSDTPFNNSTEPYRFHHCDGVTIVNSNQALGPTAAAMVQFDNCTNATITPPASIHG